MARKRIIKKQLESSADEFDTSDEDDNVLNTPKHPQEFENLNFEERQFLKDNEVALLKSLKDGCQQH